MLALDQDNQNPSDEKSVVSVQGRQGNVTFRPYRDIKTRHIGADHDDGDDDHEVVSINQLYPELLCHIFSYLDTGSKGSAAQVLFSLLESCFYTNHNNPLTAASAPPQPFTVPWPTILQ